MNELFDCMVFLGDTRAFLTLNCVWEMLISYFSVLMCALGSQESRAAFVYLMKQLWQSSKSEESSVASGWYTSTSVI